MIRTCFGFLPLVAAVAVAQKPVEPLCELEFGIGSDSIFVVVNRDVPFAAVILANLGGDTTANPFFDQPILAEPVSMAFLTVPQGNSGKVELRYPPELFADYDVYLQAATMDLAQPRLVASAPYRMRDYLPASGRDGDRPVRPQPVLLPEELTGLAFAFEWRGSFDPQTLYLVATFPATHPSHSLVVADVWVPEVPNAEANTICVKVYLQVPPPDEAPLPIPKTLQKLVSLGSNPPPKLIVYANCGLTPKPPETDPAGFPYYWYEFLRWYTPLR